MKIIPPYQIGSEILNLINQAEKYVVLVSPFVNFDNWGGIKQEIEKAKQRGVNIEFITRLDNDNNKSWEQIKELGFKPKLVKKLHAKLYYNEKNGIVTSMNLLTSSNLSAIEFGTAYDTLVEIQELKTYVKEYLIPHVETEMPSDDDLYIAKEKFTIILGNALSNMLERYVKCSWKNGYISINANNQFTLELDKVKKRVILSGIVSGVESENSKLFIDVYQKHFKKYTASLQGNVGEMSSLIAKSANSFTSDNFNFLKVKEKKEIINATCGFIDILLNFKAEVYQLKKNASR